MKLKKLRSGGLVIIAAVAAMAWWAGWRRSADSPSHPASGGSVPGRTTQTAAAPQPTNPAPLVTPNTPETNPAWPRGNGDAVFGRHGAVTLADIPAGSFRERLLGLPPEARERALRKLGDLRVPTNNLASLSVTASGQLFYRCPRPADPEAAATAAVSASAATTVAAASVPVTSPPILHSRLGATKIIYLDFQGYTVTGTDWNVGDSTLAPVATYVCVPYSSDADLTTFSDAEQAAIQTIFARVAEDYRPFDVDVTTVRPARFGRYTAHVLITRSTDANGVYNPYGATTGGVAIVDVFGDPTYPQSSPAFVYATNLGTADNIAEAASHEAGHNLGLVHDGTPTAEYYVGHGSGAMSWAPIMGSGYGRNFTQWSKGEYYNANNTEDDLAIIAAKLGYRPDDALNAVLTPSGATIAGSGVIESHGNVDRFALTVGAGRLSLAAQPSSAGQTTSGIDLKLVLELRSSADALIASSSPSSDETTTGTLDADVAAGTYSVAIRAVGYGSPLAGSPTGFTDYASLGGYAINGTITLAPVISTPPAGATVAAAGNASFSVVANGAATLTYQWRKDGVNLTDGGAVSGSTAATLMLTAVTAADAGAYTVVVANAVGSVTSSAATLIVTPSFAGYLASSFTSTERVDSTISGPSADPDADGLPNLLEYALGTSPRANDLTGLPVIGTDSGQLTLTYTKRNDVTDLAYAVEASSDLTAWSSSGVTEQLSSTALDGTHDRIVVRDLTALSAVSRRFLRLRVTLASPATSIATPPLGAVNLTFATGTRLSGMPLVNAATARDQIVSHTATTLTLANLTNVGALLTTGASYYVEVTGGSDTSYIGERLDLDVTATKASANATVTIVSAAARNTLATLPASNALAGCTIVLRPHVTLGQLFGTKGNTPMLGTTVATTADQVQFLNAQTQSFDVFYLLRNPAGTIEQWTKVGGGSANQDATPIAAGTGVVVVRHGAAPVTFTWLGEVRQNAFAQPLVAGNNLIAQPFPVDFSPVARLMTSAGGFTGSTIAANADQIQVYAGGSFQVYYLLRNPTGTIEQWTKVGGGSTNHNQTVLFDADGAVVVRKVAADGLYLVPRPAMFTP